MWWSWFACVPPEGGDRAASASDAAIEEVWSSLEPEIEAWRVAGGVPGVAVGVLVDGRVRRLGAWGTGGGEPLEVDTVFRWASVSKPHVAEAVLELEARGMLSREDRLSDWLPGFRPYGPWSDLDPTLDQLLHHTSGLADRLVWACETDDGGLLDEFDGPGTLPLLGPPGAFWNYTNSGYNALGAVVEAAWGEPFPDAMQALVLEPRGMRTATYRVEDIPPSPSTPGTGGQDGRVFELEAWDCAAARPAAWLHGSVRDLGRFVEGLPDGPLGEAMGQRVDTGWRGDGSYQMGPGLYALRYRDTHEMWFHDGAVTGFSSQLAWFPDEGLGVVVVANLGQADVLALRNLIIDRFLGYEPGTSVHEALLTSVDEQGVWVGPYEQPVSGWAPEHAVGELVVGLGPDGLTLTPTLAGAVPVPLLQTDGDAFVYAYEDEAHPVRFVTVGPRTYLVHRSWVALRVEGAR